MWAAGDAEFPVGGIEEVVGGVALPDVGGGRRGGGRCGEGGVEACAASSDGAQQD